jgi:hypothetical protein
MLFIWILLGIVYLFCLAVLGMTTLRNGHYVMFWIGFFIPILWIIGAWIGPTPSVAARPTGTA